MSEHKSAILVTPTCQNYAWGKPGLTSAVAALHAAGSGAAIDATKPYAELWMGTHRTSPSLVAGSKQLLSEHLGQELPFLFKVLSIQSALSIQAHPNKALAEALHAARPNVYKDPNHKPEMAIAVTRFEAMCGFRRLAQIARFIAAVPELQAIVGTELGEALLQASGQESSPEAKATLRQVFTKLMTADAALVAANVTALVERLTAKKERIPEETESAARELDLTELVVRLHSQHGADVGVLAPFLLNCFSVDPGECIFLAPDEPHAYVSGDIVECMACSDNVVRAGLTPKLRDTDTLCDMLTYRTFDPVVMTGDKIDEFTSAYGPPAEHAKAIPDFRCTRTELAAGQDYTLPRVPSHALCLIYQGAAEASTSGQDGPISISQGSVMLAPQGSDLLLKSTGSEPLVLFRCFAEI